MMKDADKSKEQRDKEIMREAHIELQQTKQYLERLIESSPDAIISPNYRS